jgi:hypothetical protein
MTALNMTTWFATGIALGVGYGLGVALAQWLGKVVRSSFNA